MTRNYLTYLGLKETERSNRAHEAETNRHNLAVEVETNRHNVVIESQGWAQLAENSRHNYATELNQSQLTSETIRHNRVSEDIGYNQAQASQMQAVASQISAMANQANAETNKYNADTNRFDAITRREQLDINQQSADAASKQADASEKNANTRVNELAESQRHNLMVEETSQRQHELNTRTAQAEIVKDYAFAIDKGVNAVRGVIDILGTGSDAFEKVAKNNKRFKKALEMVDFLNP